MKWNKYIRNEEPLWKSSFLHHRWTNQKRTELVVVDTESYFGYENVLLLLFNYYLNFQRSKLFKAVPPIECAQKFQCTWKELVQYRGALEKMVKLSDQVNQMG